MLVALGLDTEAEQMRSALKSTKLASASAASHDDEVLPVSVNTDASASAGASDGTDDEVLPVSVDTDAEASRRLCARLHEAPYTEGKRPDYRDPATRTEAASRTKLAPRLYGLAAHRALDRLHLEADGPSEDDVSQLGM